MTYPPPKKTLHDLTQDQRFVRGPFAQEIYSLDDRDRRDLELSYHRGQVVAVVVGLGIGALAVFLFGLLAVVLAP